MIGKPETDQVCMWHLHVRSCVWQVCCSVQSVPVQPVSDLRSKLPEYMTPADARKEAEVIKHQVKCVFWDWECTNIYHKHVNVVNKKMHLSCNSHTRIYCGQEVIVFLYWSFNPLLKALIYSVVSLSYFSNIETSPFFYFPFSSSLRMVPLVNTLHSETYRLVMKLPVTWVHCSQNTVIVYVYSSNYISVSNQKYSYVACAHNIYVVTPACDIKCNSVTVHLITITPILLLFCMWLRLLM